MIFDILYRLSIVIMLTLSISWYVRGRKLLQGDPETYTMQKSLMMSLVCLASMQLLALICNFSYVIYEWTRDFKDASIDVFGPLVAVQVFVACCLQLIFVWAWQDFVIHFRDCLK